MSDTTITPLLEELREVDFETYVRFRRLKSASRGEIQDIEAMELIDHDIIQGCIQRAIKANKWALQQYHYMNQAETCNASIFPITGGFFDADADTPAAAILAAYIEAVRASK